MPDKKFKQSQSNNLNHLNKQKFIKQASQSYLPATSEEIKALIQELRRSNSLKQKFIGALFSGFGTVIGATLLVALLIYLLSKLATIESLKPFVEQIVDIVKNAKK